MKTYHHFSEMCWPMPDVTGEFEWVFRYGKPTREQMLVAASIISAYRELLTCPSKKRAFVTRELRKAARE